MNAAGLYGFFRPAPAEPKDLFSRWPAVLAARVLTVAVGYFAVLREAAHRRDGLAMLAAGVAGYFLSLGNQGPTGGLFRLAYEHVPGFVIMREPRLTIRIPQTYPPVNRGVDVIEKMAHVKAISDLARRCIYWHGDRPPGLSGKAPSPTRMISRIADEMRYPASSRTYCTSWAIPPRSLRRFPYKPMVNSVRKIHPTASTKASVVLARFFHVMPLTIFFRRSGLVIAALRAHC